MERGDFVCALTMLQFKHPQYARILEEIKTLRPGSLGCSFGITLDKDISTLLKPYLPAEVAFLEIMPNVAKGEGMLTRLTASDPEYPIPGVQLGLYRIMVESMSLSDEQILCAKAMAHQSSPSKCLHDSVRLLTMTPLTAEAHCKSKTKLTILSLFRHARSKLG